MGQFIWEVTIYHSRYSNLKFRELQLIYTRQTPETAALLVTYRWRHSEAKHKGNLQLSRWNLNLRFTFLRDEMLVLWKSQPLYCKEEVLRPLHQGLLHCLQPFTYFSGWRKEHSILGVRHSGFISQLRMWFIFGPCGSNIGFNPNHLKVI